MTINQRLKHVRKREGMPVRMISNRLGITAGEYELLESDCHPLTVAELLDCQRALGVPIGELLEHEDPVPHRTNLLRAYKSAMSLQRMCQSQDAQVIVSRLLEDLLKIMPELNGTHAVQSKGVMAWPASGAVEPRTN